MLEHQYLTTLRTFSVDDESQTLDHCKHNHVHISNFHNVLSDCFNHIIVYGVCSFYKGFNVDHLISHHHLDYLKTIDSSVQLCTKSSFKLCHISDCILCINQHDLSTNRHLVLLNDSTTQTHYIAAFDQPTDFNSLVQPSVDLCNKDLPETGEQNRRLTAVDKTKLTKCGKREKLVEKEPLASKMQWCCFLQGFHTAPIKDLNSGMFKGRKDIALKEIHANCNCAYHSRNGNSKHTCRCFPFGIDLHFDTSCTTLSMNMKKYKKPMTKKILDFTVFILFLHCL